MEKILSILKYVLFAAAVLSFATMFVMPEDQSAGIMLSVAYILIVIAVAVAVLLPLFNLAQNPKGAASSLVGLAIVAVVAAICFAISDTTPVVNSAGGFFEDELELKFSDMGLYATYLALGVTVVTLVVGEVWNSLK